jgi:hypothetical protein
MKRASQPGVETTREAIQEASRALAEADRRACFGPSFFLFQLGSFVRDRCPVAEERLPIVELGLLGGDVLRLCHVAALTPGWAALAVFDGPGGGGAEAGGTRTELVPYPLIARVTIRAEECRGGRIGFDRDHAPRILDAEVSPEVLLERVAGAKHEARLSGHESKGESP